MTQTHDAIIIGAGQSGPSLAAKLAQSGKRVALLEGWRIGGSCVNYGCIPSKTLIASARVAHLARRSVDFGIHTGAVEVDFPAVMARMNERRGSAHDGLVEWLESLDNLDIVRAFGGFEPSANGLHRVRAGDALLEAPQVFLNTGARPFIPPIDGLDTVDYLTAKDMLELKSLPEELLILGGGYIGMEMGQAFRRFGSNVTVIEASEHIIGREDADVSEAVADILKGEGIRILTGHRAIRAEQAADGRVTLTLSRDDESTTTVSGTHLLVAIGRRPNTEHLNLEAIGLETDQRGNIVTDVHLRTNIEGIRAMGDVNGRGAFTHTSYQDFEIIWDNLQGGKRTAERNLSYALYIDPPLGRTGMTEAQARESGRRVLKAVKPMSEIGRALEQGETQGFIKILADADSEQIIGAAVLGFHGDDVIQVISNFMATGASYRVMQEALPIHPTISEFLPTILGELKPLD